MSQEFDNPIRTPNADEVRVSCMGYGCEWTPDAMRRAYDAIVAPWTEAGFPPDRLVSQAPSVPGIGDRWGSFKHKRKRLEATGFEGVETFSLSHLTAPTAHRTIEDLYPDRDWLVYATVTTWWRSLNLSWIPSLIGEPSSSFYDLFRALLGISRATYGYCYGHRYADFARHAGPPTTEAGHDWIGNAQRWEGSRTTRVDTLLLRDVFERNYLSDAHLDAPWRKTAMTLREWIEDEPGERGELKPYTDRLTEWSPPLERIPELREALFRAGRLFYYRFFNERNYDLVLGKDGKPVHTRDFDGMRARAVQPLRYAMERFHRPDIFAPWEAPDPIPEIFQADFYKDKDPGLTL
jgi:hypothetical protein